MTLEADAIERARQTAGPRGLSAYLDDALAEKLERDRRRTELLAFLDELEAADPSPPEVRRRAQRRAQRLRDAVGG